MECEKCQDRGFTEENHGLLIILCDCEKGKEYRARQEVILGIPKEEVDDSVDRVKPDNTDIGSLPKPRKRRKRKVKKSA